MKHLNLTEEEFSYIKIAAKKTRSFAIPAILMTIGMFIFFILFIGEIENLPEDMPRSQQFLFKHFYLVFLYLLSSGILLLTISHCLIKKQKWARDFLIAISWFEIIFMVCFSLILGSYVIISGIISGTYSLFIFGILILFANVGIYNGPFFMIKLLRGNIDPAPKNRKRFYEGTYLIIFRLLISLIGFLLGILFLIPLLLPEEESTKEIFMWMLNVFLTIILIYLIMLIPLEIKSDYENLQGIKLKDSHKKIIKPKKSEKYYKTQIALLYVSVIFPIVSMAIVIFIKIIYPRLNAP